MKREQRERIERRLKDIAKELAAIRAEAERDWHPPEEWVTVILANLTDAEFDAIHAARVGYSGSTGKGGRAGGAEQLGPYIATFAFELPKALAALGWDRIAMYRAGNSLIARAEHRWPLEECRVVGS